VLCLRQFYLLQDPGIAAGTPEIVTAAVLAVQGVPRMGQGHSLPILGQRFRSLGAVFSEIPAGIQLDDTSHMFPPRFFLLVYRVISKKAKIF
jgi:hypothetical protein